MGRRGDRRPKEVMNPGCPSGKRNPRNRLWQAGRDDGADHNGTSSRLPKDLGRVPAACAALAKRRRMRGYDAATLSAACNSPALFVQGLPGGVANTAADRNQIQWAGSVIVRAQTRLIHVVSMARNFQEGVGIMENTVVAGRTGALVDIREVAVDKELSREERIAEFVRQIKDPYRFKCGRFTVQASFAAGGATLEECIKGILR